MAGFTDAQEQAIINLFLRAEAWSIAADLHVGLFTTNPDDAGAGGTEVSGGSYAREAVTRNTSNWNAASGTAPAVGDNTNAITFTQATSNWGTVTGFGLFSAATAGTLYAWGPLGTSKAVNSGDTASFAGGALDVQVGDPGDF